MLSSVSLDVDFIVIIAAAFGVLGASVGKAQWLVLRWWQISRAGWRVLVSAMRVAVGSAMIFAKTEARWLLPHKFHLVNLNPVIMRRFFIPAPG